MRHKNNARALLIAAAEPSDEAEIQLANAYIFSSPDPRAGQ